jgi:signal peptidase I
LKALFPNLLNLNQNCDKIRVMNIKFKQNQKKSRKQGFFRENFQLIAEVLIMVFFINAFLLQAYATPTPSMQNNILIGDHMLINKVAYAQPQNQFDRILFPLIKIKRGMIVAFKSPLEIKNKNWDKVDYVKRVIALPGERLKIINNQVFINETPLQEPYAIFKGINLIAPDFPPENPFDWANEFPRELRSNVVDTRMGKAYRVPPGYYFCMGDNRHISSDCRIWGPLPAELIYGRPWRIFWSYESTTEEYLTPGLAHRIKNLFRTILHFFSKTRWARTFKKVL